MNTSREFERGERFSSEVGGRMSNHVLAQGIRYIFAPTLSNGSVNLTISILGNDRFIDIFHWDYAQTVEVIAFARPLLSLSSLSAFTLLTGIQRRISFPRDFKAN